MKSSFAILSVAVATASECSDGTCAQDESTLLQMQSLRNRMKAMEKTAAPGEAEYLGCFVDDGARDLGAMLGGTNNAATNTFELCSAACDKPFISLQYGGECFCANSYGNGDQYERVDDSDCNRDVDPCSSSSHNCGGSWRQAIYRIGGLWEQHEVDRSKCNLNVDLQYVTNRAQCQAIAEANGHPFYSYRHNVDTSGSNSGQNKCMSSAHCDDALIGDRTNEWNIYRVPGAEEYIGCFVDDGARDLGAMLGGTNNAATNTFELCRATCDKRYMSLQYGGECFCADSYGNGDQYAQVDDSECNRQVEPCSSNSHNCGGTWRQAIYEINRPAPIPVAEGMKCPHQHGDRLFREPESGSGPVSADDCFDLCESTAGCNHYSWGPWEGQYVCMGCTSLTNAQEHEPFTTYDMPGLTRYTLDGCGRDGADLLPLTGSADPAETADVRCCSMDGTSGVSQDFEGGEDYFRNGNLHSSGCAFGKTFLEARDLCDARGMRLCAPHEVDVTCGSGCWHNHNAVWVDVPTVGVTIDGCSTDNSNSQSDQYEGSDDSQQLIPSSQKIIGDLAAVRCCSHDGGSCDSNNGDAEGVGGAGCNDAVSFVDAQRICSEADKRLCSADEMDTCCGTGCWYNHFSVWTSSGL